MIYHGKVWKMALPVLLALLSAGCEMKKEEAWTPGEEAAVAIDEEGKITEYLSGKLDQPYYDFNELKAMADSEVSEYNAAHGEGKVTVTQSAQEDGQVKLVLTYASGEDYAAFNNVEFFYGSMINAQLAGYLFDVSYKEVRDGVVLGGEIGGSEVLRNMADMVVVVQAPLEVKVPGSVTFTSSNADVLGSDVVLASGTQRNGRTVSSASGEDEGEPDRVYIIFEEND